MSLYEKISSYYDMLFPLKEARLSFVGSFLKEGGQKILDVGCATGELALALTGKGHRVTAFDLDGDMIHAAREKTKNRGLKVEFVEKDMAALGRDFRPASFDAVVCFGNTLVHLENREKIEDFFRGVLKVLKKGGVFLFQVVNFDRVLSGEIKKLPVLENENFTFLREYFLQEGTRRIRFGARLILKKEEKVLESSTFLYPLTFQEAQTALKNAGFAKQQFFGNDRKTPFDRERSPALIAAGLRRRERF
ncbi:MAG: class I SAM-dependent methyltransferase [Candidatus Aminicenantes bacterium]|nr:class I SAM-dependent methyltransferase [Candidatus Aminicenantes bacterium]